MDNDDREKDKKIFICKPDSSSKSVISIDQIKSLYIASGMNAEEIAQNTIAPLHTINTIIKTHKLSELREAYIREGISKIQNKQVTQAQQLMDLELNFKKLRIIQLENQLNDYLAYYSRHGDFYKRHTVTGEILKNSDGIPLQLNVPNVTKEIFQLKESVTFSEGLKTVLTHINTLLHSNNEVPVPDDGTIVDIDYTIFDSSD